MEEVDQTLLSILRSISVPLPESVTSLSALTTDLLVLSVSHALALARPGLAPLPKALPKGNAARFRVCSQLGEAIKNAGYGGESGYQSFLYPVDKDVRHLLQWLVELLPKADDAAADAEEAALGAGASSSGASLNRLVLSSLSAWASRKHCPFGVRGGGDESRSASRRALCTAPVRPPLWDSSRGAAPPAATLEFYASDALPPLPRQCRDRHQLLPSLLERNAHELALAAELDADWESGDAAELRERRRARARGVVSEAFRAGRAALDAGPTLAEQVAEMLAAFGDGAGGGDDSTLFSRRTAFGQDGEEGGGAADEDEDEDEETRRRKQEEELEALRGQLKALAEQAKELRRAAEQATAEARMLESEAGAATQVTRELEAAYKVKKRTLDLLPEADKNMAQLREIGEASAARLLTLGEEWEQHRVPLLSRYRRMKQRLADRKSSARSKLESVKRMRADMKELAGALREKDELHKRVLEELARLPKSIHRGVYVRRIMDIVKNLDRQKEDIRKILADVRSVQRDINSVNETSKRSFAVTDELVFQAANGPNKSAETTRAYKCLVNMRQGFETLMQGVEETGRVQNEQRDLESRIEALEQRNTGLNMERIKADLQAVKKENKAMEREVAKKAAES